MCGELYNDRGDGTIGPRGGVKTAAGVGCGDPCPAGRPRRDGPGQGACVVLCWSWLDRQAAAPLRGWFGLIPIGMGAGVVSYRIWFGFVDNARGSLENNGNFNFFQ